MEIPDGGVETSICDLLSRAIPTSIPTRITKISVAVHMVDIWVIMSAGLKTGVLRRTEKHDLQSYLEFMIRIEASSRRDLARLTLSILLVAGVVVQRSLCLGGRQADAR
jgi:hypothetical protein